MSRVSSLNCDHKFQFYIVSILMIVLSALFSRCLEVDKNTGTVFTTLHFLPNLQMGPISKSVCPWQDFSAWGNNTLACCANSWFTKKMKCC